jgi:branched-chain amino acid transport system substrate-binding protein
MPNTARTTIRRAAGALIMLVVALVLAPPVRSAEPFEIDVILSLTGPFAFLGTSEAASMKAIEPLINHAGGINGQPVHFVIYDDQTSPATAVQLANAIIAKKPALMLGPANLASCLAVAPLVRAAGPVMYCLAPTIHPASGSYVFSGGASSYDQYVDLFTFAAAKGWKRIAFIGTNDATGQDNQTQINDVLRSGKFPSLSIVTYEHFNGSDFNVAAQMSSIKAAAPDAILAGTVGTSMGTVLRGVKDAGLDALPVLTNPGNLSHAAMNAYASFLPKDLYFISQRYIARDVSGKGPVRDAQLQFYHALAAQGIDPDSGHNLPWDPAFIAVAALKAAGVNASPKTLLETMEGLHGTAATNGIYDFRGGDQRGVGLTSLVIAKWVPAKKTWATVSHPGGKPL